MILSKADLDLYLQRDFEADDCGKNLRFFGGGYRKKLYHFKVFMRRCEYWTNIKRTPFSAILSKYYSVRTNRLGGQLGFSIPINTFGPGLALPHYGTIVVNERASVGSDCMLLPGVTIGFWGENPGDVPTVGDHCYIGTGAKLIGKITIGSNVTIGANAVVVKDVPDNAVIAGVPASIVGWNVPGMSGKSV